MHGEKNESEALPPNQVFPPGSFCRRVAENREKALKKKDISEADFPCRFYPKKTALKEATVVPYFFLNHKHLTWVLYFVSGICPCFLFLFD